MQFNYIVRQLKKKKITNTHRCIHIYIVLTHNRNARKTYVTKTVFLLHDKLKIVFLKRFK